MRVQPSHGPRIHPPQALRSPSGYTADSYLKRLCSEAVLRRYGTVTPEVEARLDEEFQADQVGTGWRGSSSCISEIVLLAQKIMEEKGLVSPRDSTGGEAAGSGAGLVGGAACGVT